MTVSYTPSFEHKPDIVNLRDRVDGNLFNVRFHAIEAEFAALQLVVQSIDNALASLSVTPAPQTVTSTFTPALMSVGASAWQQGEGFVFASPGQNADGVMDVQLPNGSTINALRAIGSKGSGVTPTGSGVIAVTIFRQPIAHGSAPQIVARVSISDGQTGTFDTKAVPNDSTVAKVATEQFRYYLVARLDGVNPNPPAGAVVAQLDAFMITHTG